MEYIGQIAPDICWKDNAASSKWKDKPPSSTGWGDRYPVRIFGIHSDDKAILPDSSLPWLEVAYPVTAGTGHRGGYQTSNLNAGAFVIVTEIAERYFITGCIANNEQTPLSSTVPKVGYVPFSAFTEAAPPVFNIGNGTYGKVFESAVNIGYLSSYADVTQLKDGQTTTDLPTTTACEKVPLGAVQTKLKKFIKDITAAKSWIEKQKTSIGIQISEGGKQYSIEEYITYKIQNVSKDISSVLKTLITNIQQFVTNQINDNLKKVYYSVFPSELQKVKDKIETANDLLACLFRKIIRNLIKMVAKFLSTAVDYLINTPLCAVENFVGALIGKITGLITSAIDAILAPVKAVLGVFDVATDILGFVSDLLSGISCDEEPSCAKIKEWSIWGGPESIVDDNADVSAIVSKMRTFAANVQQAVDPNNFDFDLDFSDVFTDTCNVGAIACGPPTVQFSGGGGTGATGNAIISAAGSIIGVDIINPGKNYTSAPLIKFYDACGKGSGAVGQVIIGPVTTGSVTVSTTPSNGIVVGIASTTKGVTKVIIEDPGSGYLPSPDGSLGGDGRTLTDPVKTPTAIYPSKSNGQYPVILKLCEIYIKESGFGYSQGDQVIIEPANGATATAVVTATGAISKIDILAKGEGFTELPNIYIQTQTGYRAKLIPRLCVERVGDNLTIAPVAIEKVINVIDCPGK